MIVGADIEIVAPVRQAVSDKPGVVLVQADICQCIVIRGRDIQTTAFGTVADGSSGGLSLI